MTYLHNKALDIIFDRFWENYYREACQKDPSLDPKKTDDEVEMSAWQGQQGNTFFHQIIVFLYLKSTKF